MPDNVNAVETDQVCARETSLKADSCGVMLVDSVVSTNPCLVSTSKACCIWREGENLQTQLG